MEDLAEEIRALAKQAKGQTAILKEIRERIAEIETALEDMRSKEVEL